MTAPDPKLSPIVVRWRRIGPGGRRVRVEYPGGAREWADRPEGRAAARGFVLALATRHDLTIHDDEKILGIVGS